MAEPPVPSQTHPSITVTGPRPPQDERALKARLLMAKFMKDAEPVPPDYKPDETPDGSELREHQRDTIAPMASAPPAFQNNSGHHQQHQQRQRGFAGPLPGVPSPRRPAENQQPPPRRRRRREEDEDPEAFLAQQRSRTHARHEQPARPRAPPPPQQRGNYTEPEWTSPPQHKYFLNVYRKKELDHRIDIGGQSHYIAGRMTNCDIQILDNSISRYHACLQHGQDGVYIYDCGSTHGTFVNDHKEMQNDGLLPKQKYKRILATDIVMFGNCPLYYVLEGGETRGEFELRKNPPQNYPPRVQNYPDVPAQPQPSNEDNRRRERDYHEPRYGRERTDIKAARDHFRERFEQMA